MSNQHPSTEFTLNAHQREAMKEMLVTNLREYGVGHSTPEMMAQGVDNCVAMLEATFTAQGLDPPDSELERMVIEAFRKISLLKQPPPRRSDGDEALAEEILALLTETSTQKLVKMIEDITPGIDGEDPSTMDPKDSLVWLRLLAMRVTCLKGISSYPAAIQDCTSGLIVLDELIEFYTEASQVLRMILTATLVVSKLHMGDIDVAFEDAIESCGDVLGAEHSSAVMDLANATMSSLTSTQHQVGSTLSLPPGLGRIKGLYKLCPGCIDTFTVLLNELSNQLQYHQVASGCERWVMSALLQHDLVGLPEKFAPATGFPVSSIFDGSDTPFLTLVDPSYIVEVTSHEVLHLYIIALFMQNRWEEAGRILEQAARMGLPVGKVPWENYFILFRALETRSRGDEEFAAGQFHEASEFYIQARTVFTHRPADFCDRLLLVDKARCLLAAALTFKIGMCRFKQGSYDAARWDNFSKCLTDVPDFMEAIEESASINRKLMDKCGTMAEVRCHYKQSKEFYETFIEKYIQGKDSSYPHVCGVTFPNRVKKAKYQKIKRDLAALKEKQRSLNAAAALPPPTPPSKTAPTM